MTSNSAGTGENKGGKKHGAARLVETLARGSVGQEYSEKQRSEVEHLGNRVLDVLTSLSDCRHETVERIMERRISGVSYVYVLDGFPQRDFVLWVFMRPTNISPFCDHLFCTGYHAQGYHAFTTTARLPRLCIYIPATTP